MLNYLSQYLPIGFFTLALAHFVALISPGADFFLIVGHSIRNGFKGSYFICIGIACANASYIILAIFGLSILKDYPLLFTLLESAGAAYLCWLGWQLINSQAQNILEKSGTTIQKFSLLKQFIIGFLSGILNPKNLIFYMSLMTSILGNQVTLKQQALCGAWMFIIVLLWDWLIAYTIAHPSVSKHLNNKIHIIERISGGILILIAVGIIYHLSATFLNN